MTNDKKIIYNIFIVLNIVYKIGDNLNNDFF